jgi:hypothetical protein
MLAVAIPAEEDIAKPGNQFRDFFFAVIAPA